MLNLDAFYFRKHDNQFPVLGFCNIVPSNGCYGSNVCFVYFSVSF